MYIYIYICMYICIQILYIHTYIHIYILFVLYVIPLGDFERDLVGEFERAPGAEGVYMLCCSVLCAFTFDSLSQTLMITFVAYVVIMVLLCYCTLLFVIVL